MASSRNIDDARHSQYAGQKTRRGEVRRGRSRASSVDTQDTYYDPRDTCYLSRDHEGEEDHRPQRGRQPRYSRHTTTRDKSPSSSGSPSPCSSRSSSPEADCHRSGYISSRSSSPSPYPKGAGGVRNRPRHRERAQDDQLARPHHDRVRPNDSRENKPRARSRERERDLLPSSSNRRNHRKPRDGPSPWLGPKKGGQMAAAGIGAAVVDTFVARRVPTMRKGGEPRHSVAKQAAQMVIGGLVVGGDRNGGGGGGRNKGGRGVLAALAGGRGKGGKGR